MKIKEKCALNVLIGGITLLLTITSAMAESGSGKLKQYAYAQNSKIEELTEPAGFTPVPEMEVTLKVTKNSDVLIQFCAEGNIFGTGTGSMQILADLDGETIGSEVQMFTSQDYNVVPRCFKWIAEELDGGDHIVSIWWQLRFKPPSSLTGRLHESVLTVLH